jgi:hypothetical protein
MNNQTSANSGASPEPQPASNDTSGQAPPVVALTNPPTTPTTEGVKFPHVEPDGVKFPHV